MAGRRRRQSASVADERPLRPVPVSWRLARAKFRVESGSNRHPARINDIRVVFSSLPGTVPGSSFGGAGAVHDTPWVAPAGRLTACGGVLKRLR